MICKCNFVFGSLQYIFYALCLAVMHTMRYHMQLFGYFFFIIFHVCISVSRIRFVCKLRTRLRLHWMGKWVFDYQIAYWWSQNSSTIELNVFIRFKVGLEFCLSLILFDSVMNLKIVIRPRASIMNINYLQSKQIYFSEIRYRHEILRVLK